MTSRVTEPGNKHAFVRLGPKQLSFDFQADAVELELPGRRVRLIRQDGLGSTELSVAVDGGPGAAESMRVRLSHRGGPSLEMDGCGPAFWGMSHLGWEGPEEVLATILRRVKGRAEFARAERQRALRRAPMPPEDLMPDPLELALARWGRRAVSLCAQPHLHRATAFAPRARFPIYRALISDPAGRLSQVLESAPGALIFAAALEGSGVSPCQQAADKIVGDLKRGAKLNQALRAAIDAWVGGALELGRAAGPRVWAQFGFLSRKEVERLCDHQRLLIRRAGFRVEPAVLLLPPPIGLVPEDIPSSSFANGRWFKTVKGHPAFLDHASARGPVVSLARVVSRHWHQVNGEVDLEALLQFAQRAGRHFPRAISVSALVEEYERETLVEPAAVHLTEEARAELRQRRFPDCGSLDYFDESIRVRRLINALDLLVEGEEMSNCVRTLADEAQRGTVLLFSARVEGQRLTISARQEIWGEWQLKEMKGRFNRLPSAREKSIIIGWWARVAQKLIQESPAPLTSNTTCGASLR